MTVARLRDEMPNNEFHQWRAYIIWKAEQQAKAQREADAKARARKRAR
jgi:hypothetical protein